MQTENRKLIYHIATSLDGYISDRDEGFGPGPQQGDHVTEYLASLRSDYDTVIMGRRTYELGLKFGVTDPYPFLQTYVVSRTLPAGDARIRLIRDGLLEQVRKLKSQTGKHIYLCGGGELAQQLVDADLVDELWLKLNPLLFGAGKALTPGLERARSLSLLSIKQYDTGVLLLKYALPKPQ